MNEIRINGQTRLDAIIYDWYGSLDIKIIEKVMDANPDLLGKKILTGGTVVRLPEIKFDTKEKEVPALW